MEQQHDNTHPVPQIQNAVSTSNLGSVLDLISQVYNVGLFPLAPFIFHKDPTISLVRQRYSTITINAS
jgi:hypothetical protein